MSRQNGYTQKSPIIQRTKKPQLKWEKANQLMLINLRWIRYWNHPIRSSNIKVMRASIISYRFCWNKRKNTNSQEINKSYIKKKEPNRNHTTGKHSDSDENSLDGLKERRWQRTESLNLRKEQQNSLNLMRENKLKKRNRASEPVGQQEIQHLYHQHPRNKGKMEWV